ncbi:SpdD protein [Streptomyces sp. NBC_00078]|uniref:SpdD protein n=1 Tax=unclassified Streptomyces TaxID=2593676 RepID=UPI0022524887|nr:SpdD protein [Streptomyces sp. NBC_00078]MCX5423683.1 SpdD protein [Streptomyces sp. NBC_00078]
MFRPKLPDVPTPQSPPIPRQHHQHSPAPAAGRSLSPYAGPVAVVLVGGVVLTALLAAVAITAISVAIAAVVLRSLLNNANRR